MCKILIRCSIILPPQLSRKNKDIMSNPNFKILNNNHVSIIFIFLFLIIFPYNNLHAEKSDTASPPIVERDGDWIISRAECSAINISREEAQIKALNNARHQAIEYAAGIQLSSLSLLSQSTTRLTSFTEYINISAYGKIIEEIPPNWEEGFIRKDSQGISLWNYLVTLKCKVQKENGFSDPGFTIKLKTNKMTFNEKDEIQLEVTSSRDCYLTIFNIYENDEKVLVIFPNDFDKDNLLVANVPRTIPGPGSGYSFEAILPEGKNESQELIQLIATKADIDFSAGFEKLSIFSYLPTPEAAVTEINKRLTAIPLNERVQAGDIILIKK